MRTYISEIENRKIVQKIKIIRSGHFRKINKIGKFLAKLVINNTQKIKSEMKLDIL